MLRETAAQLDVEEITDLCFAFSTDPIRLKVYLDVLRGKGGAKAQGAACLICFDLARQGDPTFELEFMTLLPVMRSLTEPLSPAGDRTIDKLLGESDYLAALWADLEPRLSASDPRGEEASDELVVDDAEVLEINLLDEEDILDIGFDELDIVSSDESHMREQWDSAMERFFSVEEGIRSLFQGGAVSSGFFADSRVEIARLEALRQDATSLSDHVAEARRMLPMIELFLAAHTRSKNFFGRRNKQRDQYLRSALEHIATLDGPPETAAAWLEPPTAPQHAWSKVAELLIDYAAFLGERIDEGIGPFSPDGLADEYVGSDRPQPPAPVLGDGVSRRRR
jgi:hypothetical protein